MEPQITINNLVKTKRTNQRNKYSILVFFISTTLIILLPIVIFGVIGFLLFVQNFNSYNNKETWIEKEIPLNYGFNVDYVEKGKNELEIIVQGDQTIPSEYTDYVYCALGKYAPQMRLLWGVADDEVTPIKLKLFGDTDLYKQDTNIKQDKLFLHGMVYGKDDMRLYIDISS